MDHVFITQSKSMEGVLFSVQGPRKIILYSSCDKHFYIFHDAYVLLSPPPPPPPPNTHTQ